jgi:hypothetical protein
VPMKVLRSGEVIDLEIAVSEMPNLGDLSRGGDDEDAYSEDDNE